MSFLVMSVGPIAGLLLGEAFVLRKHVPGLYAKSSFGPMEKAFGLVIVVNVVSSAVMLIMLGGKVGAARKKCIEEAKKKGDDKECEARFSYPKVYAEGFSELSTHFNCVQRGHQQALETYPSFVALSLVGGMHYPVACALGGLYWSIARWKWAEAYAKGGASSRYSSVFSTGIWTGLIVELFAASAVGCAALM